MTGALSVFYCWQSDASQKVTRRLIEAALKDAIESIKTENDIYCRLDHDTRGISGSPGITDAIKTKIDNASVFVADLTIVGEVGSEKFTPNPNVVLEFGYALSSIGEESIVGVMNTNFGIVEKLPFDINQHAIRAKFELSPDTSPKERNLAKESLSKSLKFQIVSIIDKKVFRDVSSDARKIIKNIVINSDTGTSDSTISRLEEMSAELEMDQNDLIMACEDLELHGWLNITRSIGSSLGQAKPTNLIFWDFDRIFLSHNPESDAIKVAHLLFDAGNSPKNQLSFEAIQSSLGWSLRRLNPALTLLVENAARG